MVAGVLVISLPRAEGVGFATSGDVAAHRMIGPNPRDPVKGHRLVRLRRIAALVAERVGFEPTGPGKGSQVSNLLL